MTLYCLRKIQRHLCLVFINYSFLVFKNLIFNDCIHTAHIFNSISAIYDWVFSKLWWIALIDLVDDTGSYRQAANSYPPAYLVCHINTAHIVNFIIAIYDWILKIWINCLNWFSKWYRFIQTGCKQLSPCLSGVSRPVANFYQPMARLSPITKQYNTIQCIIE